MKATLVLAVSGAVMAMAGPVEPRDYETTYVKEIVTVTITEGEAYPTKYHVATKEAKPTTTPCEESKVQAQPTYKAKAAPKKPTYKASPASYNTGAAPSDYPSTSTYHHNIHRANNSAPALSWSDSLASYAAQAAQACVFAHNLGPGGGGYGQNIAMYGGSDASGMAKEKLAAQAITDMWYNSEIDAYPSDGYNQANPDMSNFENWGHYSQVVWAASTECGCATQFCPAGTIVDGMDSWFTVCNYSPAGNVGGAYGQNVHPPQGKAPVNA